LARVAAFDVAGLAALGAGAVLLRKQRPTAQASAPAAR
jgi:hypothetical protein